MTRSLFIEKATIAYNHAHFRHMANCGMTVSPVDRHAAHQVGIAAIIDAIVPEEEVGALTAAERLAESNWVAGATFGWNCGLFKNTEKLEAAIKAHSAHLSERETAAS